MIDFEDRDSNATSSTGPQPGPAPRAPTPDEITKGQLNIAIQHMTIALSLAEAPTHVNAAPGWTWPAIRAHLTAALAMLRDEP